MNLINVECTKMDEVSTMENMVGNPPARNWQRNHQRWYAKWKLSWNVSVYTLHTRFFARLVPICMLSRCLLTKFLLRLVESLLRVGWEKLTDTKNLQTPILNIHTT